VWAPSAGRRLALGMGAHGRLGRGSPLAALDPDALAALAAALPRDWSPVRRGGGP
jgi:hypothetical protein